MPDTHPQELRGHTEVLPEAGREQRALGGEVKLVLEEKMKVEKTLKINLQSIVEIYF